MLYINICLPALFSFFLFVQDDAFQKLLKQLSIKKNNRSSSLYQLPSGIALVKERNLSSTDNLESLDRRSSITSQRLSITSEDMEDKTQTPRRVSFFVDQKEEDTESDDYGLFSASSALPPSPPAAAPPPVSMSPSTDEADQPSEEWDPPIDNIYSPPPDEYSPPHSFSEEHDEHGSDSDDGIGLTRV